MTFVTLLRFTLSRRAKRKSVKRNALRDGNSANVKPFSKPSWSAAKKEGKEGRARLCFAHRKTLPKAALPSVADKIR